nr:nodulation protein [Melilotus officinalis]
MASNNSIIQIQSKNTSSSIKLRRKYCYDVFVSFRGADTRCNVTDHLYAALKRKGIKSFKDDKNIRKGESIAPELVSAIEGSQIFIVVFSKNYAFSTWCLRELDHILYCALVSGRLVLPIFADVDPSDVRYQKGRYAKAFEKHEKRLKHELEMVRRWRSALTRVANITGWDLRHKRQYAEIEKIAQQIVNSLGQKFSSLPKDLVGMASPLEELEKHLFLNSANDVRVVGICGMRGIGKSTLAAVLYDKISHEFEACCVIDDVSKIYRDEGPIGAQKQILRQTLREERLRVCNPYEATTLIRSRMLHLKALIILDNVDLIEQLEKLAVNRECFAAGSIIIIISRYEHILKEYDVDVVYKVPLLNQTNSLQLLFYQKAFKCADITSCYEELACDMLHYANGLPLAIKVLGSFLFTLHISEWRNALVRLRESPNKDIINLLQSKYRYPLRPSLYQYNGHRCRQTNCIVDFQPMGDHHYMEQRCIQDYPVKPSPSSHLYPLGSGFNSRWLMFNDENPNSCSIM